MVRVKICGITTAEDAMVALKAGADYLGFIFYPPSPRGITPDAAERLTVELRVHPETGPLLAGSNRPLLVGVFVNERAEAAAAILDRCQLDLAQLSGDEAPSLVADPASPLFGRAYKALRPRALDEARRDAERHAAPANPANTPRLLLDTPHGQLYGGSGETGDWAVGAALAAGIPGLMLAGGLTPANVGEAVRRVRPFAVDVASGVEAAPGRKDHALVRAFIANAKA